MSEGDYGNRPHAMEDDYFYKKDRELVEKMRRAAADEKARSEMAAQIRINDPGLIKDLGELGFTPETVKVLPLMPIVQLAWAEGGVSADERKLLVSLARNRGISEGSPADLLLADWMARAPAPEIFSNAMRLIRAMLDAAPAPAPTRLRPTTSCATASSSPRRQGASSESARCPVKNARRWPRSRRS